MNLLSPYRLFWRHRKIFWSSVTHTISAKYAGSLIGRYWLVLGPLILLALYGTIYAFVFKVRPTGMELEQYILYIFSGLVPFIAVAQAMGTGAASLTTDRALILNKVFPAELIPAREVIAAGAMIIVGIGVVLLYSVVSLNFHVSWILVIPLLILLAMSTTAVVWALALLNLVAKDVMQIITYLVIIMLIASPIAYTPEMLPDSLRILLYLNPLAYFVSAFQQILVIGRVPSVEIMIGCVVIGFVSFHTMYHLFEKAKKVIADYV